MFYLAAQYFKGGVALEAGACFPFLARALEERLCIDLDSELAYQSVGPED